MVTLVSGVGSPVRCDSHSSWSVMAGLVPAISIHVATPCLHYRDCRIKSGNDGGGKAAIVRGVMTIHRRDFIRLMG